MAIGPQHVTCVTLSSSNLHHVVWIGSVAPGKSEGTMTVKTALNTQMETVQDISRQVQQMEQDASDLRAAMLNLLADTATTSATSGNDSIVC